MFYLEWYKTTNESSNQNRIWKINSTESTGKKFIYETSNLKELLFELAHYFLVSASLSKKKFNWKQRSVLVNFLPFFWKCKYTQNRHLKKERFTIQLKGSRKSLCGERAFAVKITWTTKKSEKRMVSMTTTKMTNAVANTSTWRINQLMRTRSRKRIALTPRSKDIETETELTTP